jgi:hypothetical protein
MIIDRTAKIRVHHPRFVQRIAALSSPMLGVRTANVFGREPVSSLQFIAIFVVPLFNVFSLECTTDAECKPVEYCENGACWFD